MADSKSVRKNPDENSALLDAIDTLLRSNRFGRYCEDADFYEVWDQLETFRLLVLQEQV